MSERERVANGAQGDKRSQRASHSKSKSARERVANRKYEAQCVRKTRSCRARPASARCPARRSGVQNATRRPQRRTSAQHCSESTCDTLHANAEPLGRSATRASRSRPRARAQTRRGAPSSPSSASPTRTASTGLTRPLCSSTGVPRARHLPARSSQRFWRQTSQGKKKGKKKKRDFGAAAGKMAGFGRGAGGRARGAPLPGRPLT